jgi:hypothetical protein
MKKASSTPDDGLRSEYDFSSLKGGIRGKYCRRLRAGTDIIRVAPDRASFPGEAPRAAPP